MDLLNGFTINLNFNMDLLNGVTINVQWEFF